VHHGFGTILDDPPRRFSQRKSRCDEGHLRGLRTIAALEFTKGILVLAAVLGLIALIYRQADLEDFAAKLLTLLHLNPDWRVCKHFVHAVARFDEANLSVVAAVAAVYSLMRFIESYGLWRGRVWAEWFALLSGLAYLPAEVYELLRHATAPKWILLVLNVFIVLYLAQLRVQAGRARRAALALSHGHPVIRDEASQV
jgi:uncharacterized membrane protein (DUF2068 family)